MKNFIFVLLFIFFALILLPKYSFAKVYEDSPTRPRVNKSELDPNITYNTIYCGKVVMNPKVAANEISQSKAIARAILNCTSRVTYFEKYYSEEEFTTIAKTGQQLNTEGWNCDRYAKENHLICIKNTDNKLCGEKITIRANLLRVLLFTTNSFRFMIGSIAANHECDPFEHPKGNAVDLNAVNGNYIDRWYFGTQILKDFYRELARQLTIQNNGGTLMQIQCFSDDNFVKKLKKDFPKVRFLEDKCSHIHVDTSK